jgi:hypothetical protein
MLETLRQLLTVPGFGGGRSAPAPAPLPPPPPPPPPPAPPPDPPKPPAQAEVVAKRSAKKQATLRSGVGGSIKTGPKGLLDEDAKVTNKMLIG